MSSALPPRTRRAPWYASGLRFECQPDCGRCCTRHGDYGYVYLEEGDLRSLAAHFGLSVAEYRRRFTRREDGWTVLRIEGEACPYLDGARCTVYEARPTQCRTFPFWRTNLRTPAAWESLATFCPGIGRGEVVRLHRIRDAASGRPSEDAG